MIGFLISLNKDACKSWAELRTQFVAELGSAGDLDHNELEG